MFWDKKCTIWERSFAIEDGREKEVKNQIYIDIDCDFYAPASLKATHRPTNDGRENFAQQLEVVLPPGHENVKRGMLIELFDLGSWWVYLIDTVQIHRLPNGEIDNLTLSVHLLEHVEV